MCFVCSLGAIAAADRFVAAHVDVADEDGTWLDDQFAVADGSLYVGSFFHGEQFRYVQFAFEFSLDDGIFALHLTLYFAGGADDEFGIAMEAALEFPVDADVAFRADVTLDFSTLYEAVEGMRSWAGHNACFSVVFSWFVAKHEVLLFIG